MEPREPARASRRRQRRSTPPYALRRLVALVVLAAVALLVWRAVEAASLFGSGAGEAAPAGPVASPGPVVPGTPEPATSPTPTLEPPPACGFDELLAPFARYRHWRLTLLDTRYRLLDTYEPPDLTPVSEAGFEGPFQVRRFVLPHLAELREAAEAAGHFLDVVAAYRSFEHQRVLFEKREQELGHDRAVMRTARPGHSEHQLGTAIDFKERGQADVTVEFASTPAGRWLRENAHRFGFVLSYPRGRREATCYSHEPWHFRYFGPRFAEEIHESGLTVREYLWAMQTARRGG